MTEYIDRQALLKKYCKEPQKGDCKRCDWYGDTWCRGELYGVQIAEFPAADVAPVRRGRWLTAGSNIWWCSACENDWLFHEGTPEENEAYFCPYCGAKMDGAETSERVKKDIYITERK